MKEDNAMNQKNDVYEIMLIAPILRAVNMKQVRARARASRQKLARHEKATGMSVGDASRVYDRIMDAEKSQASRVIEHEFVYGKPKVKPERT